MLPKLRFRPALRPRVAVGVSLLCLAGGLSGYQLVPEPQARAAALERVSVGGHLSDAEAPLASLAQSAARRALRAPLHVRVGESLRVVTPGALGARVDLSHLQALIADARNPASVLRRLHEQLDRGAVLDVPVPASLAGTEARDWVLRIKDEVDRPRRDARVNLQSGEIRDEQHGVALDVHATLDALEHALATGERQVEATLQRNPARRTHQQLENLDLSQVLGEFETRYSTLEKNEARTFNLRVAGEHVDGLVLMPGETFDFNDVVGERSEANGFRLATVIAAGELADGVGGGTCQIAGTLHAAAYFAGLEFLERHPHSRPSGYIKLGLDAVVSYPKLNLRFVNPFEKPIAIGVSVERGRVRVQIRGPANEQHMVSFVRRVDEVEAYEEREREDPALPQGVRVLAQRGVAGFKLTTFRIVRDLSSGRTVRQRREDSYPATTQLWRVGTGSSAPEGFVSPTGDTHSEYRADEYLVMTFDPAASELSESRRAGRTGTPGWTRVQGMPQATPTSEDG